MYNRTEILKFINSLIENICSFVQSDQATLAIKET